MAWSNGSESDKGIAAQKRDRYSELARAVIEMAWRDARPGSRVAPQVAAEAREFLLSPEADFWAAAAGIHLHKIRQILDKAPLPGEEESSSTP